MMYRQTRMPSVACDYTEPQFALMAQRDHLRALGLALLSAAEGAQGELSAQLAGDSPQPWRTLAPGVATVANANPEIADTLRRQGFLG